MQARKRIRAAPAPFGGLICFVWFHPFAMS
jgi:hypothetical protein